MYIYNIYIDPLNYICTLNDSNGKVLFEKDENGVIMRNRLDGKFSLSRTGNETLFDKIMSLTFCEHGILSVSDNSGIIVKGSFMKKDLTVSEDWCLITIKFDREDSYTCLDTISDKNINILTLPLPKITVRHGLSKSYQFLVYEADIYSDSFWNGTCWDNSGAYPLCPPGGALPDQLLWAYYNTLLVGSTWNFYMNEYSYIDAADPSTPGTKLFHAVTTYVREISTHIRLGDTITDMPTNNPEIPCDIYEWQFYKSVTIDGEVFDQFVRFCDTSDCTDDCPVLYSFSYYYAKAVITCEEEYVYYDRCRKLNSVIKSLLPPCFDDFESEFFKSTDNPISHRDLSSLMISQKSDCKRLRPDPATKGFIKLSELLQYLSSMFNVFWAIDTEGKFRIEHKSYWDNNGSYTNANTVDIDLNVIYPQCLNGTNEYTFENNLPIRETFSFMESWGIDFIGKDIDYSDCVKIGDDIAYSASLITTDINDVLFSGYASDEGFCLFHCRIIPGSMPTININTGEEIYPYELIREKGEISGTYIPNVHLSWANLHDSYWKYGRYLPEGKMNAITTSFQVRALKYQKSISFPYCFSLFDPQRLIKTKLGDGKIKTASFSFKTQWITVELEYIDTQ